jgi:catechol 2,3-dioxygenase-like lactoylglutathione lyase family enzyme
MFEIFRKTETRYPINPRFRAYGKARIDIAQRATTRDDWDRLWKKPTYPFPFSWGKSWKQCIEYKVVDFPAEVGFFIDILGFPVNAFNPDYAMFTSPNGEFYFSVVPAYDSEKVTAPDAIRLQFMVEHIFETAAELERRGVRFEQWPTQSSEKSSLLIGSFRTPNGIGIELWGLYLQDDELEPDLRVAFMDEEEHNSNRKIIDADAESTKPGIGQPWLISSESVPSIAEDQFESTFDEEEELIDVEYIPEDEE